MDEVNSSIHRPLNTQQGDKSKGQNPITRKGNPETGPNHQGDPRESGTQSSRGTQRVRDPIIKGDPESQDPIIKGDPESQWPNYQGGPRESGTQSTGGPQRVKDPVHGEHSDSSSSWITFPDVSPQQIKRDDRFMTTVPGSTSVFKNEKERPQCTHISLNLLHIIKEGFYNLPKWIRRPSERPLKNMNPNPDCP